MLLLNTIIFVINYLLHIYTTVTWLIRTSQLSQHYKTLVITVNV